MRGRPSPPGAPRAMPETDDRIREIPLRSLFRVLFRHKKKALLFFAVVFGGVFLATMMRSEAYRSKAKLLIRIGRESVALDPTATTGPTVDVRQSREHELNSELAILRSADLQRSVVGLVGAPAILEPGAGAGGGAGGGDGPGALARLRDLVGGAVSGLKSTVREALAAEGGPLLTEEDRALLAVEKGLDIDLVQASNVITVSYTSVDPELARDVVDAVVQAYLEKHIEVHKNPGSYRFFSQQAEQVAAELARAEAELRDLKNATGISSVADHRRMLLERLAGVNVELGTARAALASAEATVEALGRLRDELPETVLTSETKALSTAYTDALQQRIHELRLQEVELETNFREDSRRVQSLRQQIARAVELLESQDPETTELTVGANPTRQQIEFQLVAEVARREAQESALATLEREEARLRDELTALNEHEVEMSLLLRTIGNHERRHRKYVDNLEQARVDQALQLEKISNIAVLQPATLPLESDRPGKSLILALGLLLSLAGSVGLAFTAELLDQSLRSAAEVEERLGVRAVATLPARKTLGLRHATLTEGDVDVDGLQDFLATSTNGAHRAPPVVFGVTAARTGEGVSTVAAHLAATLARQGGGPVLLVDASVDRPRLHAVFGAQAAPGLAECLAGTRPETVQDTTVPNLKLLPAGRPLVPATRVLQPDRFEALVRSWKRSYRAVLVDLPPVDELASAARLAAKCDATLYVVQAEHLRWQVADHGLDRLRASHAELLGVVLNKRRHHIPDWVYRRI